MRVKKSVLKWFGIIVLVALLICAIFIFLHKDPYFFKTDSFGYSKFRGFFNYNLSFVSHNNSFDLYKVVFDSKNFLTYPTKIYGLLLVPNNKKSFPGVVLLPGGGVGKDSELSVASKIADLGYAVLTIDQRGVGETGGYYLNFEQDFQVFSKGSEPVQHLSVFDILRSYDLLKKIKGVQTDNIMLVGESMGGRYAIIAAALDDRIKGVITISSAGFHFQDNPSVPYNGYMLSVDPDHYINMISPRPVMMFHGSNDSMVSVDDANVTFSLAGEPKRFFIVEGCGHGYCDKMFENLKSSLSEVLG